MENARSPPNRALRYSNSFQLRSVHRQGAVLNLFASNLENTMSKQIIPSIEHLLVHPKDWSKSEMPIRYLLLVDGETKLIVPKDEPAFATRWERCLYLGISFCIIIFGKEI
jgi:hypothetical protein